MPTDYEILRGNIVSIINELSSEIDLGGQIDTKIIDEHDRIVFPLLFKNMILDSLNKQLPTDSILESGRYEYFREGNYNLEYICFNFGNYEGCKILIGALNNVNFKFVLVVDIKYHQVDSFRSGGIYSQRMNVDIVLANPVNVKDFEENDKKKALPLDFSNDETMEKYRKEKRGFATTLANRAAYYFSSMRVDNLGIIEFLEKYIK
jgi:hypothetical protein